MYKEKYLKYKIKYASLKKELGGRYLTEEELKDIQEKLIIFNEGLDSLTTRFEFTYGKKNETKFNSAFLQYNCPLDYYLKITNPVKKMSLFIYFNYPNPRFIIYGLTATNGQYLNLFTDDVTTYSINHEIFKINNQDLKWVVNLIKLGSMKLYTLLLEVDDNHEISFNKLIDLKKILDAAV